MTIYQQIRAQVTPAQAAERYGLAVARGRCCCPFHNDHHPSMKLNNDYFYCFTCHESGDVTKLTAQLLGLPQSGAARRLAADFLVSGAGNAADAPSSAARRVLTERDALRECSRLLVFLRSIKRERAPIAPDEAFDARFARACLLEETVRCLGDQLASGMQLDREEALRYYRTDPLIREAQDMVRRYEQEGGFTLE